MNYLSFCVRICYTTSSEVNAMSEQERQRRVAAVKTADAINAIEGVPVSDYARDLSRRWANGEITGEQMKAALLESHKRLAAQVAGHG